MNRLPDIAAAHERPSPGVTIVLFLRPPPEALRDYLTERLGGNPAIDLRFCQTGTAEELLKLAADAKVLVGWNPSPALLAAAARLELFICPAAGVEDIVGHFRDLARERRVMLANGHGNSALVAQHAVALLLALTNKIVQHANLMSAGKWRSGDRDGKSIPLGARKIGLLGYGAINQRIHRLLSGFDVEFHILRRQPRLISEPLADATKVYAADDLHAFLRAVDVLFIAVPRTSATEAMIGGRELELLGAEGLLVNVARGAIVEERALYAALKDSVIAGAAIDAWYLDQPRPLPDGRKYPYSLPFHELHNIVLSPKRGASPLDDLPRWTEVVENIRRFATGRRDLLNLVDLDQGY